PDFTLNDINGKPLSLSSLRGKHVVLDFWGSWCGWCIKGMPQMKEYYAKYKDKLEILGIDCNDTEEKWKAAVAKHELPWLHVYNPRGSQDDVCSKYGIRGFPTKILVGPDGKIVKTVVGEDPEFYTLLDSLFK
ncbi:MAG: peroxiredoxin family protein, partial [Prevotella sp.]